MQDLNITRLECKLTNEADQELGQENLNITRLECKSTKKYSIREKYPGFEYHQIGM